MTQVNLMNYQGVNAHERWASGVLWGFGCSGGAEVAGIHSPCFRPVLWVNT